jgi:hypothetical protein
MLAMWTEILPLFIVRWLARRYCERVSIHRESHLRTAAIARPDVLVIVVGQVAASKGGGNGNP